MVAYETIYMTNDSGDIWAVSVARSGFGTGEVDLIVDLIVGVCGPLAQPEITQANLDASNFEFDSNFEQIEWAEQNLTRRVKPPFPGDR